MWWEYFARLEKTPMELIEEDTEAMGGLVAVGEPERLPPPKRSTRYVVSPYNAQARCLREHLDAAGLTDVRVGTVDKFHGQEAAIAFFSMATSSGEDVPPQRRVPLLAQPAQRGRLARAVHCGAGDESGADDDPVPDGGADAAGERAVSAG